MKAVWSLAFILVLVVPSGLAVDPGGTVFATGMTCSFQAVMSFDPPLGTAAQVGTIGIGTADGECVAAGVICEPSDPLSCTQCPMQDTPVCVGLFDVPIGDGSIDYAGDCHAAQVDHAGPAGVVGALVGGTTISMLAAFVGPQGQPGLASVTGVLTPAGGDACAMAEATCDCRITHVLWVPA